MNRGGLIKNQQEWQRGLVSSLNIERRDFFISIIKNKRRGVSNEKEDKYTIGVSTVNDKHFIRMWEKS